jgi:hypothetical protein
MTGDENLQLPQNLAEMMLHGLASRLRLAVGDRAMDLLMLRKGALHAAWLGQQSAPDALQMRADRIEDFAHSSPAKRVDRLQM